MITAPLSSCLLGGKACATTSDLDSGKEVAADYQGHGRNRGQHAEAGNEAKLGDAVEDAPQAVDAVAEWIDGGNHGHNRRQALKREKRPTFEEQREKALPPVAVQRAGGKVPDRGADCGYLTSC
jgi:hypothetical protein